MAAQNIGFENRRMRRCQWCLRPYDEIRPRTQAEIEQLTQTLFLTGPQAVQDFAICNTCFGNVVGTAMKKNNNSSLDVGGSNHGPPNMVLRNGV